ncbi:MAG: hypothetical protein FJZ47_07225 [Candidatus Tectomicrobia bacterium]|uniref:4Fe-4S ferredoxin-type domain-containing protein n=1 Tax=Tectimicrobiota bacterium TaxID=2528274 RepID=A0A938B3A8_UNCTE|nr:hypothetical protein [Candidatus Tectomicrobia bacterium]
MRHQALVGKALQIPLEFLAGRKATAAAEAHRAVAIKCDLCTSIDVKHDMRNPACVQNCPTGAAIRVRPDYLRHVESL